MIRKYCIVLVSLLLLIMAMPLQVFAMEGVTTVIPFAVENIPGTIMIEALDDGPLPDMTEFADVLSGEFGIYYTEPGDYCYRIYQKPGTQQDVVYDQKVYTALVSVFVDEKGEMYAVLTVNVDGASHKPEKIMFTNTTQNRVPGSTFTPAYRPDNSHNDPSFDEVLDPGGSPIYDDGEEFPDDAPDKAWERTNNELSDGLPDTPSETTPNINEDKITSAVGDGLPQTGQLWWPVPIMLVIGILLFGTGIMLRRKEQKEG